jgi:glucose-1-phosphate thymidylyltransferase
LRETNCPALLAFERAALIERSNIPEDRIAKFATAEVDDQRFLRRIVEKPDAVEHDALVSMNAWLFSPLIFDACRAIGPSERGEYEITAAVQHAIDDLGARFAAVRTSEVVLDLSNRADVVGLARFFDRT